MRYSDDASKRYQAADPRRGRHKKVATQQPLERLTQQALAQDQSLDQISCHDAAA